MIGVVVKHPRELSGQNDATDVFKGGREHRPADRQNKDPRIAANEHFVEEPGRDADAQADRQAIKQEGGGDEPDSQPRQTVWAHSTGAFVAVRGQWVFNSGWHVGHQCVERPAAWVRTIVVPHRRQGCPWRP